jgi:hypothetical protein
MGDGDRILRYEAEKKAAEIFSELRNVHLTLRLFSYSVSDSSLTLISLI